MVILSLICDGLFGITRAVSGSSAVFSASPRNLRAFHRFQDAGADAGIGMRLHRRELLAGPAIPLLDWVSARGGGLLGALPWQPNAGTPPEPVKPGPWLFLTGDEGRAVEALADRIIPADAETPGGKDAGCAVFLDRQLAGPYGRQEGYYIRPPFMKGTKQQ